MKDYRFLQWNYSSSSSGGTYLKSEYVLGSKKYYYKLSDFRMGRFTGCETAIEVIASRLGECLGFPVLKYTGDLAVINIDDKKYTTYVAKSLNYVRKGCAVIPLITDYLTNRQSQYETPLDYCRRIGLQEYLDYVFLFDYLIMNVDRHGHNIELIYDNNGNITPSPIFDNGRALTYEYGSNTEFMKNWDYKSKVSANNFVGSIYLDNNLKNVSRQYKLPRLNDDVYKKIFYGMGRVISKEHQEIIKTALDYRYGKLLDGGFII